MRVATTLILTLVALALRPGIGHAQDEEDDPLRPGLVGRYTDSSDFSIDRLDRTIGFAWPAGSPDGRLRTGRFRVAWRGFLMSQATGTYRLHAHVAGKVRIQLNDQEILNAESDAPAWKSCEPVELPFDYHRLMVEYESGESPARLALFWSGPRFSLEPIGERQFFHDVKLQSVDHYSRGQVLVRSFRCAACHEFAGEPSSLPAPALDSLAGNIRGEWLVHWLASTASGKHDSGTESDSSRRMPHFPMTRQDAQAIADYLLSASKPLERPKPRPRPTSVKSGRVTNKTEKSAKKKQKRDGEGSEEERPKDPVASGRELALTLGCIACHRLEDLGENGVFGGGDLSRIAEKRPGDFFARWLVAPETINADHRMPVFELADEEVDHLATFLRTLGRTPAHDAKWQSENFRERGRKLFTEYRCVACHRGPESEPDSNPPVRTRIGSDSNWDRACIGDPAVARQPRYILGESDNQAIVASVSATRTPWEATAAGERILAENNCLACHLRDESPGLASKLAAVAARDPALAPRLPAMTPPPLSSVGDKLQDAALRDSIRRTRPPRRTYLLTRMPRFRLSDSELESLVNHLIHNDRVPEGAPEASPTADAGTPGSGIAVRDAVGTRLLTSDGFGCTSCHQVGGVLPSQAPLNARGPSLSMLGSVIRESWFDRFVRNPSRIVPRMEMPSVQVPVRGVLDENLDRQLAAVWEVLNRPGFEPPLPNPVRTVRHSGFDPRQRASLITDVVRAGPRTFVKPALIGLSNRHSIMLDLETAGLVNWTIGDVARQRTEGKSWYWEAAGEPLLTRESLQPELRFRVGQVEHLPIPSGQFLTEIDEWSHHENGVRVRCRLHFSGEAVAPNGQVTVIQHFAPLESAPDSRTSGFRRSVEVNGLAPNVEIRLVTTAGQEGDFAIDPAARRIEARRGGLVIWEVRLASGSQAVLEREGAIRIVTARQSARVDLDYVTELPVDRFPESVAPVPPGRVDRLHVVPGFLAERLPLTADIMPTALAWRPDETLLIASLKGQVWLVRDHDGDGLGDELIPFSDELAAPYGLFATDEYVDVINKYALLRIYDDNRDGRGDRTVTIASGWGHTTDYHDWAVGLPRDEQGNYYVGLPCQQDQRSTEAAYLRGSFLRLVPRSATPEDPRLFAIETVSRGHRFPMGIARRKDGELFVTDNQGNYNPFNELNHIRAGAHFGFINALEKNATSARAELTSPAIDIPHPWTRSVNGICFLETPPAVREKLGREAFGPWEGHLIGCEYDTRRLIRMTLETVGETVQGAAYPFSYDEPLEGPALLGPVVCGVSPQGDLFIGGMRDSGWGGANNVGEVVRLRMNVDSLPNGIREMRASRGGFVIEFIRPVDVKRAGDPANYSLASYMRESTPAYGGPDMNRRIEKIQSVQVSAEGRHVTLNLPETRAGYVYELHVRGLTASSETFFPAEAHYTLRAVP